MNILLMKLGQDMDSLRIKGNSEMTSSGGSITRHMTPTQKVNHYLVLSDFWISVRDNSKCKYWVRIAILTLSMINLEILKIPTS